MPALLSHGQILKCLHLCHSHVQKCDLVGIRLDRDHHGLRHARAEVVRGMCACMTKARSAVTVYTRRARARALVGRPLTAKRRSCPAHAHMRRTSCTPVSRMNQAGRTRTISIHCIPAATRTQPSIDTHASMLASARTVEISVMTPNSMYVHADPLHRRQSSRLHLVCIGTPVGTRPPADAHVHNMCQERGGVALGVHRALTIAGRWPC